MNILLVDDHPMTAEGYKNCIERVFKQGEVVFSLAYDCESAYKLVSRESAFQFDVAILDHGLPPYNEKGIYTGGDLAIAIKNITPDCKIIIITAHTEVIIVYDIYKKV